MRSFARDGGLLLHAAGCAQDCEAVLGLLEHPSVSTLMMAPLLRFQTERLLEGGGVRHLACHAGMALQSFRDAMRLASARSAGTT